MPTETQLFDHVRNEISSEKAEALGRACFAAVALNDGACAILNLVGHKTGILVSSPYGDQNFKLELGEELKSPAQFERELAAKTTG